MFKKIITSLLMILCLTTIMSTTFTVQASATTTEIAAYNNTVSNFTAIDVSKINAKIEKGDMFFLYIGRGTCPWCRKLVPVLNELAKEQGITIFNLDSQNTQQDANLSAFRNKYGVQYVPTVLFFNEGKASTVELKTLQSNYTKKLLLTSMEKYIKIVKAAQVETTEVTSDYDKVVANFTKINVANLKTKIKSGDSILLYTGRGTCPWCVKFVPVLNEIAKEKKLTVYYLDSENTQTDAELKNFRNAYKIETVPSLLYFRNGKYRVVNLTTDSNSNYNKQTLLNSITRAMK